MVVAFGEVDFDVGGDFTIFVEIFGSHEVYELATAGAFAGDDGLVNVAEVDVGLDGVFIDGDGFADDTLAFVFASCPSSAGFNGLNGEIVSIDR